VMVPIIAPYPTVGEPWRPVQTMPTYPPQPVVVEQPTPYPREVMPIYKR
jgi:hypothetical protein